MASGNAPGNAPQQATSRGDDHVQLRPFFAAASNAVSESATTAAVSSSVETGSVPLRKPVRLRSACTECHCAKVRCSGETHGCSRCTSLGLRCEYKVSMVGRASKRQKSSASQQRAARTPSIPLATYALPQDFIHLPSLGGIAGPSLAGPQSAHATVNYPWANSDASDGANTTVSGSNGDLLFRLFDDQLLATNVMNSEQGFILSGGALGHDGSYDPLRPIGLDAPCTADDGLSGQQLLQLGQELVKSPPPPPQETTRVGSAVSDQIPQSYRDKSKVAAYPHAAALMDIIEQLESCVQLASAPIDQIISMNRGVLNKLPSIMDMDGFKVCHTCPILVTTIMDLVVGLYDMAVSTIQAPPCPDADMENLDSHQSSVSNHSSTSSVQSPPGQSQGMLFASASDDAGVVDRAAAAKAMPTFSFGCLELDAEEQAMFRNQVLKLDLRRCIKTIQACAEQMLRRQDPRAASSSPHAGKRTYVLGGHAGQGQWYKDVEEKATMLLKVLQSLAAVPTDVDVL